MLEILRVISHRPKLLKHNVIFLFNGAEENLLQVRQFCLISIQLNLLRFLKDKLLKLYRHPMVL